MMTTPLLGKVTPRLWTPELRPLTPETSRGFALVDWASENDLPVAEHQAWWFRHALEIHPEDPERYRHRVVVMIGGRQGTFKTSTAILYALWRLMEDEGQLCIVSSAQRDNAREAFLRAARYVEESPKMSALLRSVRRANGQESIEFKNGARFKVLGKPENARGNSADVAWMDELLTHETDDMWAAIRPTITARPRGQLIATSNAGTPRSVVLNTLREAALAGGDDAPFIAEWSSEPGKDLDDWEGLAQALPGLGRYVPIEDIRSALKTTAPNKFRAEYRCEMVDNFESLIDPEAWEFCADRSGNLTSYQGSVHAAIDISDDSTHVTLALAAALPNGKVRVETYEAWTTPAEARKTAGGLLSAAKPRSLTLAPGPATAILATDLKIFHPKTPTTAAVAEACAGFVEGVSARRIVHGGDPMATAQILGVQKQPAGDGFRFKRAAGNCDAALSYALAYSAAHKQPNRSVKILGPKKT